MGSQIETYPPGYLFFGLGSGFFGYMPINSNAFYLNLMNGGCHAFSGCRRQQYDEKDHQQHTKKNRIQQYYRG